MSGFGFLIGFGEANTGFELLYFLTGDLEAVFSVLRFMTT